MLYLAATPHSASATLMAVREEHPTKGSQGSIPHPVEALQPQDNAPEASADPAAGIPPEAATDPSVGGLLRPALARPHSDDGRWDR